MAPLALLLAFVSLSAFAESKARPCEEYYAQLKMPPLKERLKNIGSKAYGWTFKNTVNDVRGAWVDRTAKERAYLITHRIFFAPRTREKDPIKRAAELKKIQWVSTLNEPMFDGAIEVASQLKMKHGPKIGLSDKPLETNLGLIGGAAVSMATGYGTMAYLTDQFQDWYDPTLETQLDRFEKTGETGAKYMGEWQRLGMLDEDTRYRLNEMHVSALKSWLKNLKSKESPRPLPPRLYQLRMEGMLTTPQETVDLESIALRSYLSAKEWRKGNPKVNEDKETKRLIGLELDEHPSFKNRSPLEKKLLAMVLDPPVFLDGRVSDLWMDGVQHKQYDEYKARRLSSDTYWLTQLVKNQKDPTLAKIREDFLKKPEDWSPPFLAAYTALNFAPKAKPDMAELREGLLNKQNEEIRKFYQVEREKRAKARANEKEPSPSGDMTGSP